MHLKVDLTLKFLWFFILEHSNELFRFSVIIQESFQLSTVLLYLLLNLLNIPQTDTYFQHLITTDSATTACRLSVKRTLR